MTDIDTIRERHRPVAIGLEPDVCDICIEQISPGLRFRKVPWPCDTRIVLDALDRERARGTTWLNTRDAARADARTFWRQAKDARADADRLAEALRQHLEHYYDCWADGTEYLVYNGTPDTSDLRAALRQHDEQG